MAGFSDAPAEVIDNIVRFVIRRADLANLCLVNKGLHRSAVPHLYSSIKITWDREHPNPSISPLIRTLAQSPELVTLIDEIYLFGEYLSDTAERPSLNTTGIPLDQFIDIINKTQVPYARSWVDGLESGNMDAFAGLLIANLSKITSLRITHNFINGDDILGKVLLSKVFGELPAFERLKTLSYVKRMDRGNWERNLIVEYVASLFHIPTVTDMSVSMTNQPFEWYGMRYTAGQGRPCNFSFDENIYPDPRAVILIRRPNDHGGDYQGVEASVEKRTSTVRCE